MSRTRAVESVDGRRRTGREPSSQTPPFFSDRQSAGGGGPYLRVGEPIAISSWARAICNEPVSRCAHETSSAADLIEFFTLRLEGVCLLWQPPRLLKTEGFEIETSHRSNARTVERVAGAQARLTFQYNLLAVNSRRRSRTITTIVVLVAIAVLLCAALAFAVMGDHMGGMNNAALVCCFVLTVALSVFLLVPPDHTAAEQDDAPRGRLWPLPETAVPPWPPDLLKLGSLLI